MVLRPPNPSLERACGEEVCPPRKGSPAARGRETGEETEGAIGARAAAGSFASAAAGRCGAGEEDRGMPAPPGMLTGPGPPNGAAEGGTLPGLPVCSCTSSLSLWDKSSPISFTTSFPNPSLTPSASATLGMDPADELLICCCCCCVGGGVCCCWC